MVSASEGRAGTWRYNLREFKSLTFSERKKTLERYGNACGACGHRCGLEVHHIEGECFEPLRERYNDPSNLIVLCSRCHTAFTTLELHYICLYQTMAMPFLRQRVK